MTETGRAEGAAGRDGRLCLTAHVDASSRRADDGPIILTGSAVERYARLVASGPTPWQAGDPADDADLAVLEEAALVRRTPEGVEAVSPFVPMNALIRSGLKNVARTHETAADLERAWRQRPADADAAAFEIVRGAASEAAWERIVRAADSIDAFNHQSRRRPLTVPRGVLDLLRCGVTINVIYDAAVLSDPEALDVARVCIEAGEHARVLPGVPFSMLLTGTTATISLPGSAGPVPDRLLVHAPRLLQVLKAIFAAFWNKAIPISANGDAAPGREEDVKMLALLAAGLTDYANRPRARRQRAHRAAPDQQHAGAARRPDPVPARGPGCATGVDIGLVNRAAAAKRRLALLVQPPAVGEFI